MCVVTLQLSLLVVIHVTPLSPQVVAGSYCTYAVKFDGSVCSCGEGSYGRLGHGGSENETEMRIISALQGGDALTCMLTQDLV